MERASVAAYEGPSVATVRPNVAGATEGERAEQSSEALRFEHIANDREARNDRPADQKSDENWNHFIPDFTNFRA
jgi:hypothetical protein